ncbi:MAG: hypothetical protein WCP85_01195 [Mariniphaga sp.]
METIWIEHPTLLKIREDIPLKLNGICSWCILKSKCLGSCMAETYYRIMDNENTLIPVLTQEDWNELFEMAEKQGIACYLYYALKQKKSEDVI